MCVNNDLKTLVLRPTYLAGRAHKEGSPLSLGSQGDPERARTSDLQIRNLSLYPLSYGIIHNRLLQGRSYYNKLHSVKACSNLRKLKFINDPAYFASLNPKSHSHQQTKPTLPKPTTTPNTQQDRYVAQYQSNHQTPVSHTTIMPQPLPALI